MMTGNVIALHALLRVLFHLPDGSTAEREFVIDTGFTGFLTLPPEDVAALGLTFRHRTPAYLADGSEIQIPVYDATILWNDSELDAPVLATGHRPLLGTSLLKNHSLWAQFADFGLVEVEAL